MVPLFEPLTRTSLSSRRGRPQEADLRVAGIDRAAEGEIVTDAAATPVAPVAPEAPELPVGPAAARVTYAAGAPIDGLLGSAGTPGAGEPEAVSAPLCPQPASTAAPASPSTAVATSAAAVRRVRTSAEDARVLGASVGSRRRDVVIGPRLWRSEQLCTRASPTFSAWWEHPNPRGNIRGASQRYS